jgi:multiple sugar transport system substrate-binding protein
LRVLKRKDLKMKKSLLWVVILLICISMVVAFSLAGCKVKTVTETTAAGETAAAETSAQETPTAEGKIELIWWHHEPVDYRMAAFQEVIDKFEAENPDIHVVQEAVPWDDVYAKTLAAIKTGTGPDLQMSNPVVTIYAYEAGGTYPVTDIVNEIDQEQTYFPNILKPYYHHDEYWGVPIWHISEALLYRPSMLEKYIGTTEAPKTWTELTEYAKKLTVDTDGDGTIDQYGIGLAAGKNNCTPEQMWNFISQAGIDIFDENGNVAFYNPDTVKAVEYYTSLFEYTPEGVTGWGWGEIEMNFPSGTFAMTPYYGAGLKIFYEQGIEDLAAAPIPLMEGGQKNALFRPEDIMVFKSAEERGHLDAVKKLIKFIMKPEIHWIITAKQEPGLYYPSTKAQMDAPYFWDYPVHAKYPEVVKTIADVANYGSLYGFAHGAVNLSAGRIEGANIMADMLQKIIVEGTSADEAVKWAHDEMVKLSEGK